MLRRFILLSALLSQFVASNLFAAVLHVSASVDPGQHDGLSWTTAFPTIAEAFEQASAGDEIWVAAGIYHEQVKPKEGVSLFGGFSGTEANRNQRNWNIHESVVDGGGTGRVVSATPPFQLPTRVDGFIIRNGAHDYGGGVYIAGGNFILANTLIQDNQSSGPYSGAGVFADVTSHWPDQPILTLFTALSDQLLKNHSADLSSSSIPLFPTNRYTPEVHRLLQVAANICDTTTNRGEAYPYYPSVFRPIFTNDGTNIAICGYAEGNDAHFISNTWLDLQQELDRNQLFSDQIRSNANIYGQPIIIGARKGFPNFNEFSMETVASVVRRLELRKLNGNPAAPPGETNQMYLLSVTNVFGVEAWNSYGHPYDRPIELKVMHSFRASVVCENLFTNYVAGSPSEWLTHYPPPQQIVFWPTFRHFYPNPQSFVIPLRQVLQTLPTSQYSRIPPNFSDDIVAFRRRAGLHVPNWVLRITNRLQYFAISDGRIVDFVNLDGLNTEIDLSRELFTHPADPMDFADQIFWQTNAFAGATGGIQSQLDASLGQLQVNWNNYSIPHLSDASIKMRIDQFRHFMGLHPLYGTTGFIPTNQMEVPFTPMRTLYHLAQWQANDPLVHHQAHELTDDDMRSFELIVPPTRSYTQFTRSNVGSLNDRYNPFYDGTAYPNILRARRLRDETLQDREIIWPDDWDFPSEPILNLAWLDRIHRGTPWQTLFTSNSRHSSETWSSWAGSNDTHATNDWKITEMLLTNKSLGTIPATDIRPSLINNTIMRNSSPFAGSGITILSTAGLANNIISRNESGVRVIVPQADFAPEQNIVSLNGSENLVGFDSHEWNLNVDPQFVSAKNARLRATSPAVDAADGEVSGLLPEPARWRGMEIDFGAYELGPEDRPVIETIGYSSQDGAVELRVIGYSGESYRIERSADLVNWHSIYTNQTSLGSFIATDQFGEPAQFYRATRLP